MGILGRLWRSRTSKAASATTPAAQDAVRFDVDAASLTDTGPVREHNEDCLLTVLGEAPAPEDSIRFFALADGMGGHQAGEVAAQLAIEVAKASYLDGKGVANDRKLLTAMAAANAAVFAASHERVERQGMGTTLLLLALGRNVAHYSWVGDSRLYHWRDGALRQLTEDDTLVMRMARDGLIPRDAVATHPDRNVLFQALGTHAEIPVLRVNGPFEFSDADRFLLCSDGLHDVVSDEAIAQALGVESAHEAASALIRTAIERGTEDNVSVCVVRIASGGGIVRAPRTTAIRSVG